MTHCFDGYYAANDNERSLVPASRLQAWIEQNVYLSLKSVPFSKDDATLVPEAGSCANCPKRTGFNTLLFSEVREDSCADATCFNGKLDAHITQRLAKVPNLVMISENYNTPGETPVLPRRNYVEVVTRKSKKGRDARPEKRLCGHLTPAIHTDGMDKGRLVKVCADPTCKIHFGERQEQERQQIQWKAERKAANQKAKQTLAFRHRLLADVLTRVKPQLGADELRMVARFVLHSLSHELLCRLAKRHGFENPKDVHDWQMAEKVRTLYKKADAAGLAVLIFEAMLIGAAGSITVSKDDDPLAEAAVLHKVDTKALHRAVVKAEQEKVRTKANDASEGKASVQKKSGSQVAHARGWRGRRPSPDGPVPPHSSRSESTRSPSLGFGDTRVRFADGAASGSRLRAFPPTGETQASHFSRHAPLRSAFLSPTIRIVTPVTLPTISA